MLFAPVYPLYAQDTFAPLGAEWWYQGDNYHFTTWPGGLYFNETWTDHVQVTKDTLINNISCREVKVSRTTLDGRDPDYAVESEPRYWYFYDNGDTTFVYNGHLQRFMPLYIYNVSIGDTLNIVYPLSWSGQDTMYLQVEDIRQEIYGGQALQTVYTKAYKYYENQGDGYALNYGSIRGLNDLESTGRYVQRLGMFMPYVAGFFPYGTSAIPDINLSQQFPSGALVCYKDGEYDLHMGQEACDYLPKPLSVAEHLKPGGPYRLYPNPAAKEITFDYGRPLPAGTSLSLFDCLGKIALPAKDISGFDKISLPVNHLAPGLYLLRLQAGDQQFYYKLSIQRERH